MAIDYSKLLDGNSLKAIKTYIDENGVHSIMSASTVAGSSSSGSYKSVRWYVSDVNGIKTPYHGMKIAVKIPLAGVSTAGVILSLNGNSDDDYHPVAYNLNTVLTTHYPVNTIKIFTYDATATMTCYKSSGTAVTITGVWKGESNYDSNTTTTYGTLDYYFRPYVGANRLTRYKIVAVDKDNRIIPITTEQYVGDYSASTTYAKDEIVYSSGKYYKSLQASNKGHTPASSATWWSDLGATLNFTPNTTAFRPEKLWFYNTTTTIASNSVIGGQILLEVGYSTAGCTYNFTGGVPAYRLIYLKGTYDKITGLFTLDTTNSTSYFTLVPDNVANLTLSSYFTSGKDYILVGATYSTANYFQLFINNAMYHFDGTNLVPYETWNTARVEGLIPSVSNATITIKQTGISDQTFTLNGSAVTITLADTNTWRPLGTGATDACAGNDSRLSDARTPTSHTHGNIQNDGTITSTVVTAATGILVYDSSNKIQRATAAQTRSIIGAGTSNLTIGTTATTAAAGNHDHNGTYQPLNANLTAISNIALSTSTSGLIKLVKDSGGNLSAAIDSNTYLTTAVTKLGTRTGDITIATLKSDLGLGSAAYTASTDYATSGHAHGNITNTGTITSTAVTSATGVLVYDSSNKIQRATAANARSIIGAGTYSKPSGGIPASDLAESYYLASNPNGYTSVTETTVSGWGFTKNAGTVTSVDSVSPLSGNVALSAVRYVSQSLTDAQKTQARTNIGAGTSNLAIGTTATTAAAGNHTHTLTIATDSGTATVNLAYNTTYKLTAGGSNIIFKMPASSDTNYYPIRSYTSGLQISSYSGSTDCQLYVPYATNSQAGAVSTGDQTFNGNKTFSNGDVCITEGALKINSDDYGTWSEEDWDTWFKADRITIQNADTEESWDLLFPQLSDGSEATLATLEANQTFTGINTFQGGGGGGGQYGSDLGYIQFKGVSSLSTAVTNLRALGASGTTYNVLLPARNGTLATTDQIPAAAPTWWYYESSFTRTLNSGSSVQGPSLMKINSTSAGSEYAVTTSGSTISTVNIKIGDLIFTKYGEIACVTSVPSAGGYAPGYVGYRVKWLSGASWYCLEEGALITMSDGSQRPIEEVKQGDSILGWDFENNKPCEAIALFANFTHRDDKTNFVVFSNGEYISGTEDHFIYSVDKGRDAPISELQEGEKCLDANGEVVEIYGIHRGIYQMGQKNFYHLVSSNNTYFANGVMNAAHPINKFNWMAYGANQNIPQEVMNILIQDAEEFRTYEFLVKNETFRRQSVNLMKEIKTRQNKITELKQFLADTDYVTIKHSEGLPIDPEILEERQNARDTINQLREEIDNNYQPAYNNLVIEYSPLGADTLLTNEERRAKYFKVANKRDNEALNIFKKYYQKDNKNDE